MVERALLTAGIVVFIIGALGALGESAARLSQSVTCSLESVGGAECDGGAEATEKSSKSTRRAK